MDHVLNNVFWGEGGGGLQGDLGKLIDLCYEALENSYDTCITPYGTGGFILRRWEPLERIGIVY